MKKTTETETTKISMTELTQKIKSNCGRFMSVTFEQKDGEVKTVACRYDSQNKDLGLIAIKIKKEFNSFYPNKLKGAKIKGVKYVVK